VVYLGGLITPSGVAADENAYILNLKTANGGYLDASAMRDEKGRPLGDENPSAVAHLVNHSSVCDNVEVLPFSWGQVLWDWDCDICTDDRLEEPDAYYGIPNVARFDRAPHYAEGSEVLYYNGDVSLRSVCGAAFCSKSEIDEGDELFLDYGLVPPIPTWAAGFYNT